MNLKNLTREQIKHNMKTNPDAVADLLLFLIKENTELKKRVKELEDRLNQNSQNSSRPPSSDGFNKPKPKPKSLRGKSGKKSGGQPGHKGNWLEMSDHPDHTVSHAPASCEKCQHSLEDVEAQSHKRRQVYDFVAYIKVTEHQAQTKCCPQCEHANEASFPEGVPFATQYGNTLKAFTSYCSVYQLIPSDRIRDMVFDLTGHRLSEGTLYNTNNKLAELLVPYEEEVKQLLLDAPVIHNDESGLKVSGKNHWLHSASTEDLTYFTILDRGMAQNPLAQPPESKKRGKVAQSKTRNLLDRLDQNHQAVLLFMHDFRVPFTNNQAEQDVRMIKVQQKVSGAFRTLEGAQRFARIRGYISTLRKQGISIMDQLGNAFKGNPWMPKSPPQS